MVVNILAMLLAVVAMEGVAWFTHKYIMHGFLWFLHVISDELRFSAASISPVARSIIQPSRYGSRALVLVFYVFVRSASGWLGRLQRPHPIELGPKTHSWPGPVLATFASGGCIHLVGRRGASIPRLPLSIALKKLIGPSLY